MLRSSHCVGFDACAKVHWLPECWWSAWELTLSTGHRRPTILGCCHQIDKCRDIYVCTYTPHECPHSSQCLEAQCGPRFQSYHLFEGFEDQKSCSSLRLVHVLEAHECLTTFLSGATLAIGPTVKNHNV